MQGKKQNNGCSAIPKKRIGYFKNDAKNNLLYIKKIYKEKMQKVASSDIKSSLARTRQNKEEQSPSTSREFRCANSCPPTSVTRLRFYTGKITRTIYKKGLDGHDFSSRPTFSYIVTNVHCSWIHTHFPRDLNSGSLLWLAYSLTNPLIGYI
jgi:hypothetical protein